MQAAGIVWSRSGWAFPCPTTFLPTCQSSGRCVGEMTHDDFLLLPGSVMCPRWSKENKTECSGVLGIGTARSMHVLGIQISSLKRGKKGGSQRNETARTTMFIWWSGMMQTLDRCLGSTSSDMLREYRVKAYRTNCFFFMITESRYADELCSPPSQQNPSTLLRITSARQ